MHQITIVSLGPGSREQLTLGAFDALKKARRLILRTGETDAARYLQEQGVTFETLDGLHEAAEDFDDFIRLAVERVAKAAARGNAVYAVLDALSDETAAALLRAGAAPAAGCRRAAAGAGGACHGTNGALHAGWPAGGGNEYPHAGGAVQAAAGPLVWR